MSCSLSLTLRSWEQIRSLQSADLTAAEYVLQAFDELLLLQRGGSTLYCGPVGEDSKSLITYFEKLGAESMTPGYNPATWMLENTTASVEEQKNVNFAEAFQESDLRR